MMSDIAIFTYKCRHCGQVYRSNTECSDDSAANHLTAAMHGMGYPTANQPPVALLDMHKCDGSEQVGIADLAGYVVVPG